MVLTPDQLKEAGCSSMAELNARARAKLKAEKGENERMRAKNNRLLEEGLSRRVSPMEQLNTLLLILN